MIDQLLKQAELLLETNRPAEAEKKIRQALAENPEHPGALSALAWCLIRQDKYADALPPAQQAVALEADHPYYLFILGYAWLFNNQVAKARETVQAALHLAPDSADLYHLMAQIEFHERRWELALHNVEKGLEIDPENESLVNLRAMTLVKLNRTAEAGDTVDSALYKNPENSWSHANKGWVAVEKGDYAGAQKSFMEALRIDPTNEHAQEGLKESIKAKNPLYRFVLRYFLWMNKLSEGNQWLVIIGAYVAFRIIRSVSKNNPGLQPFLMPLIVLYIIFVYSSWIAAPVSNLILRLHPLGKHALTDDEKKGSTLTGACLGAAALTMIAGFLLNSSPLLLGGTVLFVLLIPVAGMFSTRPGGSARKSLGWYAGVLAVAGLGLPLIGFMLDKDGVIEMGLGIFGIGALAYGWVANYLIMRDGRRF